MSTRVQDSPFRETEWDQRLDKMLDDLNTTVSPSSRPSSRTRENSRENALVSSFRSSSRDGSRSSTRGGIEDGGQMKHKHSEFTSPDHSTKVVSDQYSYDSGDTSRSNNAFQKKVLQSTYSSYNVKGDISSQLEELQKGPSQFEMDAAAKDTKVVSASQKVANKLVDALASIGSDGEAIQIGEDSSTSTTLDTKVSSTGFNTLQRLHKNINELDNLIDTMDEDEKKSVDYQKETTRAEYVIKDKNTVQTLEETVSKRTGHEENMIAIDTTDWCSAQNSQVCEGAEQQVQICDAEGGESKNVASATTETTCDGQTPYTNEYFTSKYAKGSSLVNGPIAREEDEGNEVRRIVWRNRFEKTCEAQDSTAPSISIEEAAKAAQRARNQPDFSFNKTTNAPTTVHNLTSTRGRSLSLSPRQMSLQYAVYWPHQFSPSNSPGTWVDPIPIPTPPSQLSPGEPGVAYVYTYGQNSNASSRVQHLPPLNYVTLPPAASVPGASDGAPSPTPSSASNQPIIYHYSYHYNILPGQTIPDGVPKPPGSGHAPPPALQMAPPTSSNITNLNSSSTMHNAVNSSSIINQNYSSRNTTSSSTSNNKNENIYKRLDVSDSTRGKSPTRMDDPYIKPRQDLPSSSPPSSNQPNQPNSNIKIHINKTTTHTTHTKEFPGGSGPSGTYDRSGNGPTTSTPFGTPGRRSRSTSPEKSDYPRSKGPHNVYPVGHPLYHTTSHYYSSTHRSDTTADSLERLKRPTSEGLPFPDTSPIKGPGQSTIPRRVDDLMTSFSDSDDGPGSRGGPMLNGTYHPHEREPLVDKVRETEITNTTMDLKESQRDHEMTKNKAGAPVYYPPGHQQLFSDAMHTMTLKEDKRRGMAKWRMEKSSGMKESSSSSESKGGMAMVPVCLPLCCGAACTIM